MRDTCTVTAARLRGVAGEIVRLEVFEGEKDDC